MNNPFVPWSFLKIKRLRKKCSLNLGLPLDRPCEELRNELPLALSLRILVALALGQWLVKALDERFLMAFSDLPCNCFTIQTNLHEHCVSA